VDAAAGVVGGYRIRGRCLCRGRVDDGLRDVDVGMFGLHRVGLPARSRVGAWAFGTWLATRPRPKTKLMEIDPIAEWRTWRCGRRWSQPGVSSGWAGAAD